MEPKDYYIANIKKWKLIYLPTRERVQLQLTNLIFNIKFICYEPFHGTHRLHYRFTEYTTYILYVICEMRTNIYSFIVLSARVIFRCITHCAYSLIFKFIDFFKKLSVIIQFSLNEMQIASTGLRRSLTITFVTGCRYLQPVRWIY